MNASVSIPDTDTPALTTVAALRRFSFWLLLVVVAAFTYSDYWGYSALSRNFPDDLPKLLSGHGPAPAQYRVGVLFAANALVKAVHGRIAPRHVFALFDFSLGLAALLTLREVLFRTVSFKSATVTSQWLRAIVLAALAFYYFTWGLWYQRPETIACTFFVAASVYLLLVVRSAPAVFIGLVLLAFLQGFIRADVAILFHLGLFLYLLRRGDFLVSRGVLLAASFLGGLLPTAILWFIMHKVYPHATYGDTRVFQLILNLSPMQLAPFLLFLTPTVYTFLRARKTDAAREGPAHFLFLSSGLYLVSWALVGRIEEVRIFVPFAVALMPLTANALAARIAGLSPAPGAYLR